MRMPSEHSLPEILIDSPQFNRPLALTVRAIANLSPSEVDIPVIDVGAGIGETVAVVEQCTPGICSYLCIDAEPDLVEICRHNHANNTRVQAERHFIGELEGVPVRLVDDGRANAMTTTVAEDSSDSPRLVRLDSAGNRFAQEHGKLRLIKVDVEGLDFAVLRSAEALLRTYKPHLYFEWYPERLAQFDNDVYRGFDYLVSLGFSYFVFFTNVGDYHISLRNPDRSQLEALCVVTSELPYFDVFASTSAAVFEELARLNIGINQQH